jgi:hypothetical protein
MLATAGVASVIEPIFPRTQIRLHAEAFAAHAESGMRGSANRAVDPRPPTITTCSASRLPGGACAAGSRVRASPAPGRGRRGRVIASSSPPRARGRRAASAILVRPQRGRSSAATDSMLSQLATRPCATAHGPRHAHCTCSRPRAQAIQARRAYPRGHRPPACWRRRATVSRRGRRPSAHGRLASHPPRRALLGRRACASRSCTTRARQPDARSGRDGRGFPEYRRQSGGVLSMALGSDIPRTPAARPIRFELMRLARPCCRGSRRTDPADWPSRAGTALRIGPRRAAPPRRSGSAAELGVLAPRPRLADLALGLFSATSPRPGGGERRSLLVSARHAGRAWRATDARRGRFAYHATAAARTCARFRRWPAGNRDAFRERRRASWRSARRPNLATARDGRRRSFCAAASRGLTAQFDESASVGRVGGERGDRALDLVGLAAQEIGDRAPKPRVADPVRRMSGHRQVAARQLVLALRAGPRRARGRCAIRRSRSRGSSRPRSAGTARRRCAPSCAP